jgi:hypothetical protein
LTSKKGTTKQTSKQLTVARGSVIAGKMSPSEHRAKAITSVIGKIMVLDYQTYSMMEDRGFQELLHTLEPRYRVPSRTVFFGSVIPEMYCKILPKT